MSYLWSQIRKKLRFTWAFQLSSFQLCSNYSKPLKRLSRLMNCPDESQSTYLQLSIRYSCSTSDLLSYTRVLYIHEVVKIIADILQIKLHFFGYWRIDSGKKCSQWAIQNFFVTIHKHTGQMRSYGGHISQLTSRAHLGHM